MEQIPKIARVRMATQVAGAHPEAELLSAFAENALTVKERQDVLAHLAECAHCREVVSLAAEARPQGSPLAKPARGGFRWATFQWAAVAASVAIVTVAVLVVGPKGDRGPQPVASATPHQQEAERQLAPSTPPALTAKDADRAAKPDASASANATIATRAPAGVVSGVARAGGGIGGGGYRVQLDKKEAATDSLAKLEEKKDTVPGEPAAKAPASSNLAYSGSGPGSTDGFVTGKLASANQPARKDAEARQQVAQAAPPISSADAERGRLEMQAKSNNDIQKQKGADVAAEASTESVQLASRAAAPKGHSSEKTAPAKKTMAGVSAPSPMVASFNSTLVRRWRVQSGKLESSDDAGQVWNENDPAKNVQLTKVVAAGDSVWAGGKAGALFVSRDSGQSWTKISLTGDDVIPLGDVTDIKLAGSKVDVLLASGDDWQSNDGGKSFRLLPRKP